MHRLGIGQQAQRHRSWPPLRTYSYGSIAKLGLGEQYEDASASAAPDAKTVLITFPLTAPAPPRPSQRSINSSSLFYGLHSQFTRTDCANAEVELLALSPAVRNWLPHVAPTKDALPGKGGLYLTHGLDLVRDARNDEEGDLYAKTMMASGRARACMYDSRRQGDREQPIEFRARAWVPVPSSSCVYSSNLHASTKSHVHLGPEIPAASRHPPNLRRADGLDVFFHYLSSVNLLPGAGKPAPAHTALRLPRYTALWPLYDHHLVFFAPSLVVAHANGASSATRRPYPPALYARPIRTAKANAGTHKMQGQARARSEAYSAGRGTRTGGDGGDGWAAGHGEGVENSDDYGSCGVGATVACRFRTLTTSAAVRGRRRSEAVRGTGTAAVRPYAYDDHDLRPRADASSPPPLVLL
ncbi:hypothetical protein DFH08DRAFT_1082310 [Mycena albidolilacea]|uniref:Uncharacterized protein n=1 Tax=Mycena albidolilacea TaxID=1033008 RepID=A0AAD6ZV80_9AGAR|nr:hypothetical protein DFH08DRAFT_1082310 [Mycena albidolilacea]